MLEKNRNYRLRSKIWKTTGMATIGATTIGGVSAYNFVIAPHEKVGEDFQVAWESFIDNIWIDSGGRLNMVVALPILISIVIWLIIVLKKNKSFFSGKISLALMITILIFYSVYSLIGYILSSLIGALVGVMASEFIFEPLSLSASEEADFKNELKKEKRRERVRREVSKEEDFSGVV